MTTSDSVILTLLFVFTEVALKVHLSDASTHQPLAAVTVEIFTNHTSVASDISGADGNAYIRFPYRLGDLLVVTATKRGYVPNSIPWRPNRLPVFSSLSLDLLPERAATLMVYDDVVQIVSGYQDSKLQPWVQFQRRALSLPSNATYTNLTAFLTVSSSTQDTQYFPYLQGLHPNYTGIDRKFELTPIAAISVHLLGSDGVEFHVSEPISVSIPLPANSGLKENDHIPAWRFDPKLGAWLKSSLGYVQREGKQLTLTYIAPQLGYWVAAMSPINTGPVVAKDISTYHTVFLLAILGGMALILLFLLCLLLYYCRRKCARLQPVHRKCTLSSALDASKRDQATSMSHLNLIIGSRSPARSPEREQGIERRPADYMLSRSVDHLERPAPLPRPGALLCCTSELQVNQGEETYRKARPTLVIPAHYMRLPGTHPLSGQALLLQSDEQSELESIQAELSACHQPQNQVPHPWGKGEQEGGTQGKGDDRGGGVEEWTLQTAALPADLSIPNSLSQGGLDVVQMNGEDQLLAEKTLMALRGGKPLPHPRAWFVSLDGRSNAHIRHSYIDLQTAGCNSSCVGSNDASLDSGVDMSDVTPGRRVRDKVRVKNEAGPQPAVPVVGYTPLVFVEDSNANAESSSSPTPVCSPEEHTQGGFMQEKEREEEDEGSLSPPSPPPELPSPPPLPEPVVEVVEEAGTDSNVFRTEETQMHMGSSRPDNLVVPDDGGEDENKK
ncbi:hypothetical protein cypCar_00004490, partial [Cyprinus carpio]